jgi:hypothetical protein
LLILLLVSAWACTAEVAPPGPTEGGTGFDEEALWRDLPLPDDAESVPVGEGIDLGFATRMVEPELFDFYAAWLSDHGWRQQAPTEAMVTLPHQVWRKEGAELLIEIQGLDEEGNTVVWIAVTMDNAP